MSPDDVQWRIDYLIENFYVSRRVYFAFGVAVGFVVGTLFTVIRIACL